MPTPADQLSDLLIGLFNIALRPQGKVISAQLGQRLRTAVTDATAGGDPIYDLLDDLLTIPQRPAAPAPARERTTVAFDRDETDMPHWRQKARAQMGE